MPVFDIKQGSSPLIVSIPHAGIEIPADIRVKMGAEGCVKTDTDWHIPQLYGFLEGTGATVIAANYSRYVIDLNRPPDGKSLYPGQASTGLCPTTTFDGEPLYLEGQEPSDDEVEQRRETHWQPYHDQLQREIDRVVALHGRALLWDAHSIRNHVPRLFDGALPDFNFGTNEGATCPDDITNRLVGIVKEDGRYSAIANGRFKGGYITRHYGAKERVRAIQLELSQSTYMNQTAPFDWREDLAGDVMALIERLVKAFASAGVRP